jgi:hypothetical protein
MAYTSDVYVPMFARINDQGKLVAVCVLDPNPGSTQYIDITLSLMKLFDARRIGDVPMTTQT